MQLVSFRCTSLHPLFVGVGGAWRARRQRSERLRFARNVPARHERHRSHLMIRSTGRSRAAAASNGPTLQAGHGSLC